MRCERPPAGLTRGPLDLGLADQITAHGATWLDRRLLDREAVTTDAAFGAEVTAAMEKRAEHLAAEGLARRRAQRFVFARDLLATLRQRELDDASVPDCDRFRPAAPHFDRRRIRLGHLPTARKPRIRPLCHDR